VKEVGIPCGACNKIALEGLETTALRLLSLVIACDTKAFQYVNYLLICISSLILFMTPLARLCVSPVTCYAVDIVIQASVVTHLRHCDSEHVVLAHGGLLNSHCRCLSISSFNLCLESIQRTVDMFPFQSLCYAHGHFVQSCHGAPARSVAG
jgi:hypothetical protein